MIIIPCRTASVDPLKLFSFYSLKTKAWQGFRDL
jgi:hypothetical protein